MENEPERRQELAETRAELISSVSNKFAGAFGYLVGAFLSASLGTLFFSPWSFYMGGRFTPTATWEGNGVLRASTGANYGLYVKLSHYSSRGSSRNLDGVALLCTPKGSLLQYRVYGWVDRAWFYTEGKQTRLDLWKAKGSPVDASFHLHGTWQRGGLVLMDRGSLGIPFHADGSLDPRGIYSRAPLKNEHAEGTIAYGSKFEFDELCANQIMMR